MTRSSRTPVKVHVGPRLPWWAWGVVATVLVAVVIIVAAQAKTGGSGGETFPNAPLLARVDSAVTGATVDGIRCGSHEESLFHIHAHLAVVVNGSARDIPQGIGIAPPRDEVQTDAGPDVAGGSCFYWLHTHTADGIIHIESPVQRTFTLGDFFDEWGQPLSPTQVGPAHGAVIAYLNGTRFGGDPRSIPLTAHALVQLDVGRDAPPQAYTFPSGL